VPSLPDAIAAGSFFEHPGFTGHQIAVGDVDAAIAGADHVVEGEASRGC
jgi:hypothetical protein